MGEKNEDGVCWCVLSCDRPRELPQRVVCGEGDRQALRGNVDGDDVSLRLAFVGLLVVAMRRSVC
jgi:hypothetical protein